MSCSQQDVTIEASGERCTELRLVIAVYIIIIVKNTKYFLPDLHRPVHCEITSILYSFCLEKKEKRKISAGSSISTRTSKEWINRHALAGQILQESKKVYAKSPCRHLSIYKRVSTRRLVAAKPTTFDSIATKDKWLHILALFLYLHTGHLAIAYALHSPSRHLHDTSKCKVARKK